MFVNKGFKTEFSCMSQELYFLANLTNKSELEKAKICQLTQHSHNCFICLSHAAEI